MPKTKRQRRKYLIDKTRKNPAHMVDKYLSLMGKYMALCKHREEDK
jgi:hypothetical protein